MKLGLEKGKHCNYVYDENITKHGPTTKANYVTIQWLTYYLFPVIPLNIMNLQLLFNVLEHHISCCSTVSTDLCW
jgi:hypothetical protein